MRKIRKVIVLLAVLVALVIWIAWGNQALQLSTYDIQSDRLPAAFDEFHILQLSDLHNTQLGEGNEKLISVVKEAEPDLIVITGDLIDSRDTKVEVALELAEKLVTIVPCYYVPGNHESRVAAYAELKTGLLACGVVILENKTVELQRAGEKIALVGVTDPDFGEEIVLEEMIDDSTFTILLSHRPELFETYVESGVDLVFSGHAHGGQFRVPFVGGLYAPHQGLFPQYDGGIYTEGNTTMVVSRGLGNSVIPFRINNRPEAVLVVLSGNHVG